MFKIVPFNSVINSFDSEVYLYTFEHIRDIIFEEKYEKIIINFDNCRDFSVNEYELMIGELYGWIGWDYLSEVLTFTNLNKNETSKLEKAILNAKELYFKNTPQSKFNKHSW